MGVFGAGSLTTGASVIGLYRVIFTIILDILLAVFVATLVVASVGSGVVAQAGQAPMKFRWGTIDLANPACGGTDVNQGT